jgi:hypothetical protein
LYNFPARGSLGSNNPSCTLRFAVRGLVPLFGEYRSCPIVLLSSWQLYSLRCSIGQGGAE